MTSRRAPLIDAGRPAARTCLAAAVLLFGAARVAQACPFCGGRGGPEADVAFYALMALVAFGLLRRWWQRRR